MPNLIKISPLGTGQAEGRTDMTKLIVAFRYFSKSSKRLGHFSAQEKLAYFLVAENT
jgi:hypothetical protein